VTWRDHSNTHAQGQIDQTLLNIRVPKAINYSNNFGILMGIDQNDEIDL